MEFYRYSAAPGKEHSAPGDAVDFVSTGPQGQKRSPYSLFGQNIVPYVKYNIFHAEDKRKYVKNPFLSQNMFYNEAKAVFGDIKFNHGFKRFRLKSNRKVKVEFGLVATAHNIRKLIAVKRAAMLIGLDIA